MSSNTKLARGDKFLLKEFKRDNPDAAFATSEDGRVTVLVVPHPSRNMGHFTVAIASEDEKKIRRKVGEFEALRRYWDGMGQPVNTQFFPAEDIAWNIAHTLGGFN